MKQPLEFLVLLTTSVLFTAGSAFGQGEKDAAPPPKHEQAGPEAASPKPPLEQNRERWKKLRPAKRREMRRLFERLKDLPPEQRDELVRRLRSLDGPGRRRALRDAREGGQRPGRRHQARVKRLLEELTPEERERFHGLSPREQRRRRAPR